METQTKIKGKVVKEEVVDGVKVVYVRQYYDSQLEAYRKYREGHLDEIRKQQRERFKAKWDQDPEFREKKKEQNRLRSQIKRQQKIEAGEIVPKRRLTKPVLQEQNEATNQ